MKTYDMSIKGNNPCNKPCPNPCANPCPKPCPDPIQPIDCNKVIAEYHKLIAEAEALFDKSDMLIYKDAYEYVWKALKALEDAIELVAKGSEITDKADMLLDKSGCSSQCNRNSCQCKQIKKEYEALYALETKKVIMSIRLLEKVMCELKEAFEIDKKAGKLEEEYVKCVHGNQCK